MEIRAVAFDLDGTLYPSCQMAFSSIHLLLFHPRLLVAFSRARKEIRRIRPIEDFRKTQASLVADHMKIGVTEAYDLIDRKMYRAWKTSFRYIRPFPGCRETIGELKRRGFTLAGLSDFPVENKRAYLGMETGWDVVSTSESSGYLKPNPEPFLKLSDTLGVSPGNVLYVGNSYQYDIIGAKRAGMKTAHLTRNAARDSEADFSFSRFDQLLEFLNGIPVGRREEDTSSLDTEPGEPQGPRG